MSGFQEKRDQDLIKLAKCRFFMFCFSKMNPDRRHGNTMSMNAGKRGNEGRKALDFIFAIL
jgi:hypothetical protein